MCGFISHGDDLVVVDPQQVSDNDILPLLRAETEAEHGQSHDTHDDIYQFGSQQTCKNISCTLEATVNVVKRSIGLCGLKERLYLIGWFDSESVGSVVSVVFLFFLVLLVILF